MATKHKKNSLVKGYTYWVLLNSWISDFTAPHSASSWFYGG